MGRAVAQQLLIHCQAAVRCGLPPLPLVLLICALWSCETQPEMAVVIFFFLQQRHLVLE